MGTALCSSASTSWRRSTRRSTARPRRCASPSPVEGPPGIGKTALLGELGERRRGPRAAGAAGARLGDRARLRLRRRPPAASARCCARSTRRRARLFAGPAALAAAIFGLAGDDALDLGAAPEPALYGLFWLLAGLAESGPLVLAIDDAHWADVASLRFVRYLAQRLDGLPVLVALAARPNEPGAQAEICGGSPASAGLTTVRPPRSARRPPRPRPRAARRRRLAADRGRLPRGDRRQPAADRRAPGRARARRDGGAATRRGDRDDGLRADRRRASPSAPGGSAPAGSRWPAPPRSSATPPTCARSRRWPRSSAPRAAAIVDGLAAASILAAGPEPRLRPPAAAGRRLRGDPGRPPRRGPRPRRRRLLREQRRRAGGGRRPPPRSASPAASPGALDDPRRGRRPGAAERGAPESAVAYLGRALPEADDPSRRGEILHRLGTRRRRPPRPRLARAPAGRRPSWSPTRGGRSRSTLELIDVLSIAGLWDGAVATIDAAFARFGESGVPGLLELEAFRAASAAYDPARGRRLRAPTCRACWRWSRARDDESPGACAGCSPGSARCRHAAGGGARADRPGAPEPDRSRPHGRESTAGRPGSLGAADRRRARRRRADRRRPARGRAPARLAVGDDRLESASGGASTQRRGRLASAEAELRDDARAAARNELEPDGADHLLHFCLDTVVERPALADVRRDGRGARGAAALRPDRQRRLRCSRCARRCGWRAGDARRRCRRPPRRRRDPRADRLRAAVQPLALAAGAGPPRGRARGGAGAGRPRNSSWPAPAARRGPRAWRCGRSAPCAAARPGSSCCGSRSATLEDCPSALELARSLAELGAALRRGNRRAEARELLREASDLAQAAAPSGSSSGSPRSCGSPGRSRAAAPSPAPPR